MNIFINSMKRWFCLSEEMLLKWYTATMNMSLRTYKFKLEEITYDNFTLGS